MKTSALRAWGWVGALAMTVAIGCATKKPAAPAIAWNTNYDAALADARTTGRPILLDFYTDW